MGLLWYDVWRRYLICGVILMSCVGYYAMICGVSKRCGGHFDDGCDMNTLCVDMLVLKDTCTNHIHIFI